MTGLLFVLLILLLIFGPPWARHLGHVARQRWAQRQMRREIEHARYQATQRVWQIHTQGGQRDCPHQCPACDLFTP